jgi:hypothetical protein
MCHYLANLCYSHGFKQPWKLSTKQSLSTVNDKKFTDISHLLGKGMAERAQSLKRFSGEKKPVVRALAAVRNLETSIEHVLPSM